MKIHVELEAMMVLIKALDTSWPCQHNMGKYRQRNIGKLFVRHLHRKRKAMKAFKRNCQRRSK